MLRAVTAELDSAAQIAAIAIGGVAIVTFFGAVEGTIAATDVALAKVGASVRVVAVAVVACFATSAVDNGIATALRRASRTATVTVDRVAVVALFATRRLRYAIAAAFDSADTAAAVAVYHSAIVTLFRGTATSVTTAGNQDAAIAAVRSHGIAVVALFGSVDDGVAAAYVAPTKIGAAIHAATIAVVAFFGGIEDGVPAAWQRAIGVTAVPECCVAIVALFTSTNLRNAIAAAFHAATRAAAVIGGRVAVIAFLRCFLP